MTDHERRPSPSGQARETLRQMVEEAGVGLFEIQLDGRIVFANKAMADLLGFPDVAAVLAARLNTRDIYSDPNDQQATRRIIETEGVVTGRIFKGHRADGSVFWGRETSTPIRDAAGKITGYVGSISDVTDLIQTQQKLAEAEASYRRIFERATEGIYRSTLDGRQLRANPALVRLNGYDSEEEQLEAVKDIATEWYVDPDRRDEFKRLLERDGVVEDFESEIYRHHTRERIWVSENAYLVCDEEGQPLYYEGTVRDVTSSKRAERATQNALERAEAASRAKTDFLAHMSHELRTPLNAILGFSELLLTNAGTFNAERIADYANAVHTSGSYLLDLINDVLDLSRIESGTFAVRSETLSAADCLRRALETMRPLLESKHLSVDEDLDEEVRVRADRRALHQCLLNLLSNAVKFTPAGSALEVALTGTETGQVVFSVRDKGPGVPPPVLERLGEPFVAQDDPQHTKEPGSGLGLAITRSLMERMSGELAVANVTGGGAEARLTLPRD